MAISLLNSASKNGADSNTTSGTDTYTCPSGSTLLVAFVTLRGDVSASTTCTATFNGVSMTQIGLKYFTTNRGCVAAFYMQNPPTGSAYTFSASWDQKSTYIFHFDTFSGTDTSTTPFGWVQVTGQATSGSLSVTGVTAGDWALDCFLQNTSGTLTQGTGQTLMNTQQSTSRGADDHMSETSYEAAGGTSVEMTYSSTNNANYVYAAFALKMGSSAPSTAEGNWFLMF